MTDERLATWTRRSFDADGISHDTYRKGSGPGVIVIHEFPGITPTVLDFAEDVVAAGFTVVLPNLFGKPGAPEDRLTKTKAMAQVCVSREFVLLRTNKSAPVTVWLRALARELHAELGGPGVGAVGMCFTGGYALAMTIDDSVIAPVLAQPSLPVAITAAMGADLGLDPDDRAAVQSGTCPVLGLRFTGDRKVGTRFDTLRNLLGDRFERPAEYPGARHSVLTRDSRLPEGVDRVLEFLRQELTAG